MRSRIILLPAFLLAAGLMLPACGDSSRAEPLEKKQFVEVEPLAVSVIPVEQGDLLASLSISGSLSARSRVAVIPKMSGTLRRVLVDIGDHVGEGQVVAVQDTRELDAQLDAAKAAVAVASASLEQAALALTGFLFFGACGGLIGGFVSDRFGRDRTDSGEARRRSRAAQRKVERAGSVEPARPAMCPSGQRMRQRPSTRRPRPYRYRQSRDRWPARRHQCRGA